MKKNALLSWSGGKDSALAFNKLKKENYNITLLTTVSEDYDRISIHGVRSNLLRKQAELLDSNLEIVFLQKDITTKQYEEKMVAILTKYQESYVAAFGDLFLEDIRKFREANLAQIEMESIFPLWGQDTTKLAHRFIEEGFQAIITCVDTQCLGKEFVGRLYDRQFLADLPDNIDPCGENGEFHTFVYNGPIFKDRIEFTIGEKVLREDRFYYCDLVLNN